MIYLGLTTEVFPDEIVSMMGAPNVRESIDRGVTAFTARRVPPVSTTKNAHTKAPMAPRNQAMHLTTAEGYESVWYRTLKECQRRPKVVIRA